MEIMGQIMGYDSLVIATILSWTVVLMTLGLKRILIKKTKDDLVEEESNQEEKKIIKKSPFHKMGNLMRIFFYIYVGCAVLGGLTSWYLGKVPEIGWKTDLWVIFGIFIPGIIFFNIGEKILGLVRKAKTLEKGGDGQID